MALQKEFWQPTKFEELRGRWRSSRVYVGIGSRLNADLIAAAYQDALERFAKGSLVDLGCGNAPLTGVYQSLVCDYTWADWAGSPHSEYEIDVSVDLNHKLPFGDSAFDTVLLSDVLEHIAQPDALFAELTRITKVEGVIIVGVPFLYQIHEAPYDYHRYTRYKLQDFAVANALDVLVLKEYGGGVDVLQDIVCKMLSFSRLTAWLAHVAHQFFRVVNAVLRKRKFSEKLLAKFPLGYIAVYKKRAPSGAGAGP